MCGSRLDINDADFAPVEGLAHVYRMQWANTLSPGAISQSKFDPILVDDPNQSIFTMVQEDGPLRLNQVHRRGHAGGTRRDVAPGRRLPSRCMPMATACPDQRGQTLPQDSRAARP